MLLDKAHCEFYASGQVHQQRDQPRNCQGSSSWRNQGHKDHLHTKNPQYPDGHSKRPEDKNIGNWKTVFQYEDNL